MNFHDYFHQLGFKTINEDKDYSINDVKVAITHKSVKFLDDEGVIVSFGKRVDEELWKQFATDITKMPVNEAITRILDKIDELSEIYKVL